MSEDTKKNSGFLTLEDIKARNDMAPFEVEVPQWNGKVLVRPLSLPERRSVRKCGEYPATGADGKMTFLYDPEDIQLEAMVVGCVKPKIERHDKEMLKTKSAGAISVIGNAILDASGMGEETVKKQKKE